MSDKPWTPAMAAFVKECRDQLRTGLPEIVCMGMAYRQRRNGSAWLVTCYMHMRKSGTFYSDYEFLLRLRWKRSGYGEARHPDFLVFERARRFDCER